MGRRPGGSSVIAACGMVLAAGCAVYEGELREPPPRATWAGWGREQIVSTAREVARGATRYVRGGQGRDGGYDCSGFVAAVYRKLGMNIKPANGAGNGVTLIHRWCRDHGHPPMMRRPQPGDLIFLDETYDRNGDGKIDARDTLTHVGIVESIEPDGRFILLHAAGEAEGIKRTPYEWTRRRKERYGRISGVVLVPPR